MENAAEYGKPKADQPQQDDQHTTTPTSNFGFLQTRFPEYYKLAAEAERNVFVAPRTAVIYARLTLEELIKWMYQFDEQLSKLRIEKPTLDAMMYHTDFKRLLGGSGDLINGMTLIRKHGNMAVHSKRDVLMRFSHVAIQNLYEFCKWVYYTYEDSSVRLPLSLNSDLIPRGNGSGETAATVQALQSNLAQVAAKAEKTLQLKEDELTSLREEIARMKAANLTRQAEPFTLSPETEAETRRVLIDVMLREAGWEIDKPNYKEYELTGMPNATGTGYADYVLWGRNGLPLAVVEAKNTLYDPRKGQQQAKLYADCLEQKFGRRPVIFYSNGYNTRIWDDTLYPDRPVWGFYTEDELEWMIQKRGKKALTDGSINKEIAGRPYQERALKRVAETFEQQHRKALLVMATGTGKTRTAIALVDLMQRQGWAWRILFLADRNALVTQAMKNFKKQMSSLSCVDITKEKEGKHHRMVFSTYPTIMNKIDSEKQGGMPFYSPGHFDLVIIDEAHRSVYQKYQAIFRYFDAMLVGLTATPKSEVDKNTYELFDLENHNPTDFYELDQAVADGWLVPPKRIAVETRFLREGIKYKELSDEDKERYEEDFTDEESGEMPEEVDTSQINQFVFNTCTVDLVLNHLMSDGIKIEGGDKLGKTIIFAKNHRHAEFIAERFDLLFPHLKGGFLKVIDNQADYAQTLIDDFSEAKKNPQIAVSVDMLDTGIDVPEIVNLVFFKVVRSFSKFWQMIGRGTRLCPGLFGIPADANDRSKDKKEFLIFDYCQNFEYFDVNPDGYETKIPKSVSQRIMECQILLAQALAATEQGDVDLRASLLDLAHQQVTNFNRNSFVVRENLEFVDQYSVRERWDSLSQADISNLFNKITPLAMPTETDENARSFDLLMLQFMLAITEDVPKTDRYTNALKRIGQTLLKKLNLPVVKSKEATLRNIVSDKFWENQCNVVSLERIRTDLRELIKLIEKEERKIVYTNLEDELKIKESTNPVIAGYLASDNYKQRVEKYVRDNQNSLVIQKLKKNIPITSGELEALESMLFDGNECGTKEQFIKEYGDKPLGWFIRSIVGLEVNAAKTAFGEFLSAGNLSANQIQFVDMIINYITTNGVIDKECLFDAPFTNFHSAGIKGVFDDNETDRLYSIINQINDNAVA